MRWRRCDRSVIELNGWLLDLYEDGTDGLAVWFLDDEGRRLRFTQSFPVTFYAAGDTEDLRGLYRPLRSQAGVRQMQMVERFNVFKNGLERVLAVEVANAADQNAVFRQASQDFRGLTFFDADIPIWLRYAAAYGVFPLARCRLHVDEKNQICGVAPLESQWELFPRSVPLRVLELEPDCNPLHAAPRLLHIRAGGRAYALALEPARALLVNLNALLLRHDPDLLLTSWGDTWLLPWLLEQSGRLQIPLPLNRDARFGIAWRKARTYFSYGQIVYRGEQVHLFGRWHIDRCNAMLWDDYALEGILEAARVTALPVQTAARVSPGGGISAVEMLTALRLGMLVPWQKQETEIPKTVLNLFTADQGGMVYQPLIGVHRDVAEIDFVSMYPAIMVYFNISPETIGMNDRGGCAAVPELGLMIDRSRPGIIPQALSPLLQKRVAIKRLLTELPKWDEKQALYKRRASALKWLLVTCFGYLGYKNARFGRIEAHQAVTAYGRELLLRAKETAEALGYTVLHLYVDGLWVQQAGKREEDDFQALLENVEERAGLPIALDGVYRWVVFLPSRQHPTRPVANRYFGVFQDGTIKVRGIEARRRDTPQWIAETQMQLLRILVQYDQPEQGLPEALAYLRQQLNALRTGSIALETLLLRQKLSRGPESYRSPSPAAVAAKQLAEIGKTIRPGQRVSFLFTLGKPGVAAWDAPDPMRGRALNTARYRLLLLRAASTVLAPFGADEEALKCWAINNAAQPCLPIFRQDQDNCIR